MLEISILPLSTISISFWKFPTVCYFVFFILLGRIVNVSSVRGRYAWPGGSVYHISKYGVETMSDSLRLEMVKFGVGVSVVEPGWLDGATSIISPANVGNHYTPQHDLKLTRTC